MGTMGKIYLNRYGHWEKSGYWEERENKASPKEVRLWTHKTSYTTRVHVTLFVYIVIAQGGKSRERDEGRNPGPETEELGRGENETGIGSGKGHRQG